MKAQQHLDEAAGLIGGDRARQHGDVRALHEQVAQLWTAYLEPSRDPLAPSLTAIDVLAMMALLKLARAQHGELRHLLAARFGALCSDELRVKRAISPRPERTTILAAYLYLHPHFDWDIYTFLALD